MSDLRDVLADLSERWGVMSPAEEQAYEADRMRRERRLNLAKMAEVITDTDLERIVNDRVDTYASKVIRRFLVAAAKPDGARFCWLSGATGRGKTVAACLAIAIERGRYISAESLCLAYNAKTPEAAALREHARHCRLLVVDDVGIHVTELGWFFVRGIAMVFDRYLQADRNRTRFSKII